MKKVSVTTGRLFTGGGGGGGGEGNHPYIRWTEILKRIPTRYKDHVFWAQFEFFHP